MQETNNQVNIQIRKLQPSQGMHLKNKQTNDIFDSVVYLGAYDNVDNYEEVTESEYQEYLISKEQNNE